MEMFVETKKMGTTFEEELAMIHAYHEPHVAGEMEVLKDQWS